MRDTHQIKNSVISRFCLQDTPYLRPRAYLGDPLRCTQGRPLQGPLKTGLRCHIYQQCRMHSLEKIYNNSTSCKCQVANQIYTSCCSSENCCNHINLPPIPRASWRVHNISRPTTNRGEIPGEVMRPHRKFADSYFYQTT